MIRGEKVILCAKKLDEARRDYRWQCDAELMALSGYPALEESFAQYLSHSIGSYRKQRATEIFSIKTAEKGEHIGNCAVYDVDLAKGEAQIGVLIGERQYWDLGFGTDAIKTLIGHIFKDTPIQRIYLRTRDDNLRARHCFEKCGFKIYGELMQNGYHFILMQLAIELMNMEF